MAKKTKAASKGITKPRTQQKTGNPEEAFLETLLRYTNKAITAQGTVIDEFFVQQAARLTKQLEQLRNRK